MNTLETLPNQLPDYIKLCINKHIELAIEDEMKLLQERIEKKRAEIITGVILHVQKQIEFETMKDSLIIKVRLDK